MKTVKAVAPYIHPEFLNFKTAPYEAWLKLGGRIAKSHYPIRKLHGLAFRYELPTLRKSSKEARLRFVSGYSVRLDTFPDYAFYEIIPIIWDCWPPLVENVAEFFRRHRVKTAFFTSSQTADTFRKLFPNIKIFVITEGVNLHFYSRGKQLDMRSIDILEVGRKNGNFFKTPFQQNYYHIKTGNFTRAYKSDDEFRSALADTKVTINVPRCDVDKKTAGDIETLTQRYWECMLSRVVMVGRAPKELTDLIGYNPVIDWDGFDATPTVSEILSNISVFQPLVDKNYDAAKKMASWDIRIKQIMDILIKEGYSL